MKQSIYTFNFLAALIIIVCVGCIKNNDYEFTYETIVTENPTNLENINSIYDDYNSDLPYDYAYGPGITFSSNRNTNGANFDLVFKFLVGTYHSRDDVFNFSYSSTNDVSDQITKLNAIESSSNELGPYSYFGNGNDYLFFADDSLGHFDIKYIATQGRDLTDVNTKHAMSLFNSEFDDYYPTLSGDKIYFCSNREDEVFNIYSSEFSNEMIEPDNEETFNVDVVQNSTLSSGGNDKCPFIFTPSGDKKIMLFTSDRPGGYGGFDLYYSKEENDAWSEPVNLGEKINTASDEYRPIAISFELTYETNEVVIIFSSNRDGGQGGFDLYTARYQF